MLWPSGCHMKMLNTSHLVRLTALKYSNIFINPLVIYFIILRDFRMYNWVIMQKQNYLPLHFIDCMTPIGCSTLNLDVHILLFCLSVCLHIMQFSFPRFVLHFLSLKWYGSAVIFSLYIKKHFFIYYSFLFFSPLLLISNVWIILSVPTSRLNLGRDFKRGIICGIMSVKCHYLHHYLHQTEGCVTEQTADCKRGQTQQVH